MLPRHLDHCPPRWRFRIVILIMLLAPAWTALAKSEFDESASALPIPAAAAQVAPRKMVKDLFKADYAQPTLWRTLARKLSTQADQAPDAVQRYVLLDEAVNVAAAGGDVENAMTLVDKLTATFAVKGAELKMKVLTTAFHSGGASMDGVADGFLKLADESARAGEWKMADSAATQAETLARAGQNGSPLGEIRARAHDKHKLLQDAPRFAAAMTKLKLNPDDKESNLVAGRFLCFVAGDWEKGLPMLARGSDPTLAGLAGKELLQPDDAGGQQARGDAWWDYGQKLKATDPYKAVVLQRAAVGYRKAVSELTGLPKVAVQHRLEGLAATGSGEVVVYKYIGEFDKEDHGPFFALNDTAAPDEFTVTTKPGKIRIFGKKKEDVIAVLGKGCGWLGKAVLLRTPDARGTLQFSQGSGEADCHYRMIFVDKKGAEYKDKITVKGKSHTWTISQGETEITLTLSGGDEEAQSVTMPTADFRYFGFAADIRSRGTEIDITIGIDDPRGK